MPTAGSTSLSSVTDPQVYTSDQNPPGYLDGPGIVNEYDIVQGVCILPVAESPPEDPTELKNWSPVVRIRLHSPYRIRTAKFRATKQNAAPVLPAPGDTGAFIFIGGSLVFSNVYVNQDQFNWTCETVYQYVENCVSRNIDGYVLGTPPFLYPSQEATQQLVGGVPGVTGPGAIAYAGTDAKIGWYYQQVQGPNGYNTISYFPGAFFNNELMNSGLAPVT